MRHGVYDMGVEDETLEYVQVLEQIQGSGVQLLYGVMWTTNK